MFLGSTISSPIFWNNFIHDEVNFCNTLSYNWGKFCYNFRHVLTPWWWRRQRTPSVASTSYEASLHLDSLTQIHFFLALFICLFGCNIPLVTVSRISSIFVLLYKRIWRRGLAWGASVTSLGVFVPLRNTIHFHILKETLLFFKVKFSQHHALFNITWLVKIKLFLHSSVYLN